MLGVLSKARYRYSIIHNKIYIVWQYILHRGFNLSQNIIIPADFQSLALITCTSDLFCH